MHGAAVTALNIIEVPYSLPLDAALIHRTASAEAVLRRAAAIARECGVSADTLLIRSRSIQDSILDLLRGGKYDLLVLGSGKEPAERGLSPIVETMIRKAPCRVWVCSS
jgi:nucleotide-binding universal stress UspA family protein